MSANFSSWFRNIFIPSQFKPEHPVGQEHVYEDEPSAHVPPFWHGELEQSSNSVLYNT